MRPLKRGKRKKSLAFVCALALVLSNVDAQAQVDPQPQYFDDEVAIKTLPPLSTPIQSPGTSSAVKASSSLSARQTNQSENSLPTPSNANTTRQAGLQPPINEPIGNSSAQLKFTNTPQEAYSSIKSSPVQFESTSDILETTSKNNKNSVTFKAGEPLTNQLSQGSPKDPKTNASPPQVEPSESLKDEKPETTEPTALAQSPMSLGNTAPTTDQYRAPLPTVIGSVQIRKPFKLFAREELIRNLSFRDTPVKEVIAEIARRGNLNILIDKSAAGRITGELHDVTLNEAMDNVLAASGLQSRVLDNSTVVVATQQAMVQLGLNRSRAKSFKLSYAHPFDVATILYMSVFNKGYVPDFNATLRRKISASDKGAAEVGTSEVNDTELKTIGEGGAKKSLKTQDKKSNVTSNGEEDLKVDENNQVNRPDVGRTMRGISRSQVQEGVGFNNASTDPGSQQIRQFQETPADYVVEQNGGGAIVIPDVKGRAVIVVGTQEDIAVAEETIRMIDRRPKLVHIQASLIELHNEAIRQLGASLNTQGSGSSVFVLGQSYAPIVTALPGQPANTVAIPQVGQQPTIANVTANPTAQTLFNFLTLSQRAGGHINIATFPSALNVTVNELLQTNKAKIIANPSVVVVDNTETLITLATEVAHKITTTANLGVTTTNVELTKAGIFLNVLPKTTEDGFVTMRLRPQVSSPTGPPLNLGVPPNTATVTLLNIREIMSQEVRVKDGQTLVLGGLFTEQEAAQLAKIPYAAETPILGALFRNSLKGRNRTELMLLITPKVVEEDPPASPILGSTEPTM